MNAVPTTSKGIQAWPLDEHITLVCDENNPHGGPESWAVLGNPLPESGGYETWWSEAVILDTDERLLRFLARTVADRDIRW